MLKTERQSEIIKYLNENHFATVKALSNHIFASESSVRRDLNVLERKGYLHRIHGGAVLSEYKNEAVPLEIRDHSFSAEKEKLAKEAAKQVFDGAVIFMDSSSTVHRIFKYLSPFKSLKIITNSLRLFEEYKYCNCTMYCTGGKFEPFDRFLIGTAAEKYVEGIKADICFFSSQGLSEDGIISDTSEELTYLRRAMLKNSERKIFLCDSSKVGVRKTYTLCKAEDIDMIIGGKTEE